MAQTAEELRPAINQIGVSGDTIMGVANDCGTVFAAGDPGLYNECTEGRRLPAEYDNYRASVPLPMAIT
jgi:unsaturated rhamnogalacturonyl hydrolase